MLAAVTSHLWGQLFHGIWYRTFNEPHLRAEPAVTQPNL